jgi:hypothetical protein
MMLKLAYQIGFELALQEELYKIAGIPGAGFAIPKADIIKALAKPKAAPAAAPGVWDSIKSWFSSGPAPETMKTITHVNMPRVEARNIPRSSYRGRTSR